jgi:hypothetical protein
MSIRFGCPVCKSVLEVADKKVGTKIACPKCTQRLRVPAPTPDKTILGVAMAEPAAVTTPAAAIAATAAPNLPTAAPFVPDPFADITSMSAWRFFKLPLWGWLVLGFGVALAAGAILTCIIVIAVVLSRPTAPTAAKKESSDAAKPEPQPKPGPAIKGEDAAKLPDVAAKAPDRQKLQTIFQHSPRKSIAKLVKEGSEIPPGWEGGPQWRKLTPELLQRENYLTAVLSHGVEGDTAEMGGEPGWRGDR